MMPPSQPEYVNENQEDATHNGLPEPTATKLFALLLVWDFTDRPPELLERLRRYIAEDSWDSYAHRPALRQKVWFSDRVTMRWGAFYLWETEQSREDEVATESPVQALTGVAPSIGRFEVEAIQEGEYLVRDLGNVGLAFGTGKG